MVRKLIEFDEAVGMTLVRVMQSTDSTTVLFVFDRGFSIAFSVGYGIDSIVDCASEWPGWVSRFSPFELEEVFSEEEVVAFMQEYADYNLRIERSRREYAVTSLKEQLKVAQDYLSEIEE